LLQKRRPGKTGTYLLFRSLLPTRNRNLGATRMQVLSTLAIVLIACLWQILLFCSIRFITKRFNSNLAFFGRMKRLLLVPLLLLLLPLAYAASGSMKLLATSESGSGEIGSGADIFLDVHPGSGRIFIDSFPLTKLDTVMSTRFANEIACDFLEKDCSRYDFYYTIRANAAIVGGPSAGAAISILTVSVLEGAALDKDVAITGTINSGGLIGPVGGIAEKVRYADSSNMTTVLIPRWGSINDTDLAELENSTGIRIVKVSSLREAVKETIGKDLGHDYSLIVNADYIEMMRNISESICARTEDLMEGREESWLLNDSTDLYARAESAIREERFYSAASYCFGANVKLQYAAHLEANITNMTGTHDRIEREIGSFREKISSKDIETLTDLQTMMVVSERILDAEEYLNRSIGNETNTSLYNLAYAEERLHSAYSWSSFFGRPGRKFDIDESSQRESCQRKISEVEERLEYVRQYLPVSLNDIRRQVSYAYKDLSDRQYSMCLYTASKAKAEVDIIMNTLGLEEEELRQLIEERMDVAEQIIGRQMEEEVFPIVGYSYYDYARSLIENDKFSSLLYSEYAIELSKLDIYFRQKRFELPRIDISYPVLFILGFMWGFIACFFWIRKEFSVKKRKK